MRYVLFYSTISIWKSQHLMEGDGAAAVPAAKKGSCKMESRRAAFLTLGCKVNQYETDAMTEILRDRGYKIVDFRETADVYIINTCSVTAVADKKSRQMIRRAKKKNPEAAVVACGCYVQTESMEGRKNPDADILIGNNKKKEIADIIEDWFLERKRKDEIMDASAFAEYESLSLRDVSSHTRAVLKIQDGCNQFCSYCIIPYARGRIRSRKPQEVTEEVKALAQKGFREIVLTGIHLSSYGLDLEENLSLITLLEDIQMIDGIDRIRLGSLEPRIITEEFAQRLHRCDKVCPHFHLSLQSGCDATLKRMNRKYTTTEYERALDLLRKVYDRPAVTTDVIAGFVGETEEEFGKTVAFLEKIRLYEMHIFKYSVRKGTRAEKMEGHLPDQVKTARSGRLLTLAAELKKEYEQAMIGERHKVLLEEKVIVDGKSYWQGYTDRYVKVLVRQDDTVSCLVRNKIVDVEIMEFIDKNLLAGKVFIDFEGQP